MISMTNFQPDPPDLALLEDHLRDHDSNDIRGKSMFPKKSGGITGEIWKTQQDATEKLCYYMLFDLNFNNFYLDELYSPTSLSAYPVYHSHLTVSPEAEMN